ncbi:hypothetical protein CCHR01_19228 [Colletotrichum chrysophilum]|uniref:Uncharacterized protein n=1 Tax=Colletotrichum chrysophilum TaxID=1836956 RepID=A0AAD8ZYM5_9PEZI|nr:hypothetical protein CCHR01_19228 [Colletotrichum chrysophilum]
MPFLFFYPLLLSGEFDHFPETRRDLALFAVEGKQTKQTLPVVLTSRRTYKTHIRSFTCTRLFVNTNMPFHKPVRHSPGRSGVGSGVRRHHTRSQPASPLSPRRPVTPVAAIKKKVRFAKSQKTQAKADTAAIIAESPSTQPEELSEKATVGKMPLSQAADGGNIVKTAEKDKNPVTLAINTDNTIASSSGLALKQAASTAINTNGLLTPKPSHDIIQTAQKGAPASLLANGLGQQMDLVGRPIGQSDQNPVDPVVVALDHWIRNTNDGSIAEAPKLQGCGPWEVPLPPGMDPAVHVNPHSPILCRYLDCWIIGPEGTPLLKVHIHPLMRGRHTEEYVAKKWTAWKMMFAWVEHLEQYGKNDAHAPMDIVSFVRNRIVWEGKMAREGAARAIANREDSAMFGGRDKWYLPAVRRGGPFDNMFRSMIGSALVKVHNDEALKKAAAHPPGDNSIAHIIARSKYVNTDAGVKDPVLVSAAKDAPEQPKEANSTAGVKHPAPQPDASQPAAKPAPKQPLEVIVVDDSVNSSSSSDSEDEPLAKRARKNPQPKRATKPAAEKTETEIQTKPRRRGRPVGSKNKTTAKKAAGKKADKTEVKTSDKETDDAVDKNLEKESNKTDDKDADRPVRRMIRIKVPAKAAEKLAAMDDAKRKAETEGKGKPAADK